jgi:hypothetical protein
MRASEIISELSTDALARYKKAAGADAKKSDAEGNYARGDKRFKGINKATNKQFDNDLKKHKEQGVAEVGIPFRGVGGAFNRGDDERHDLDVVQSTIYGLKINGQIWKKDGHVVTFATREKALAARNSIMLKRPELEVGLIQKGSAMESATGGATGSGSIASVAMPLGGKKKKKGAAVNLLGGPVFKR